MRKNFSLGRSGMTMLLACLLSTPAFAEKPAWAGGGKHGKQADEERPREARQAPAKSSVTIQFGSRDRQVIADFYQAQARAGHCPPGLAKKRNGCLPPGQAKKWSRGRPLPAGLVYNDLPRDLLIRLPVPPAGHRYVQVAGDVLMIAVGSSMVIDAVEDLMR